ncbi:hypothetical protein MPTK1_4g14460 [Marchantia polymorpha subsp. ruderalis]|uniref:Uncharacterized protein n=2 Tax=Marchantia polymorpha TaxID=3197 RepID=A0AAF6B9V1_MARPO|nr:hypothetical protein MARPO_0070s0035 [Marchantia polymorpha]BBN08785.1 hypothetical protein Mp_4g14460 [Marchantia polymorpha subsp. ruderalis]|eukprot:PTQ35568.1 hypothetical protein MARPO_0070s0035 [Marchantia polymorpha]
MAVSTLVKSASRQARSIYKRQQIRSRVIDKFINSEEYYIFLKHGCSRHGKRKVNSRPKMKFSKNDTELPVANIGKIFCMILEIMTSFVELLHRFYLR